MNNANEPAFPMQRYIPKEGGGFIDLTEYTYIPEGLTKREHFASLAMQSLILHREQSTGPTYSRPELAVEACHYADELLTALQQTAVGAKQQ